MENEKVTVALTQEEALVVTRALQAYYNHLEPSSKFVPAIRDFSGKVFNVYIKVQNALVRTESGVKENQVASVAALARNAANAVWEIAVSYEGTDPGIASYLKQRSSALHNEAADLEIQAKHLQRLEKK